MTRKVRLPAFAAPLSLALTLTPLSSTAQMAGCYDVSSGPWSPIFSTLVEGDPPPAPPSDVDGGYSEVPPRLRFHEELEVESSNRRLTIPENSLQTRHSILGWRPEGDAIIFFFGTGYAGTRSRVRRTSQGWAGSTESWTDIVGSVRFEHSISLTKVDCDTPPPRPAEPIPLLPLELVGGFEVHLGRPLPAALLTTPRSINRRISPATIGRFGGADSAFVRIDTIGNVSTVDLRFPGTLDLPGLVEDITRVLGPATLRGSMRAWTTRTRSLVIAQFDDGYRVLLWDPRIR